MRYLSASAAVLGAAMTFSFTPLGRTARASDDKPVVKSILDMNMIVSPSSSFRSTITYSIERYMNRPKRLQGFAEINPATCTEIAEGAWRINTATQFCRTEKCGTVTTGTETVTLVSGRCAGHTFTFATIYYKWTAHNNQSTLSAPPNSVADTFDATWTAPDGSTAQFTFDINVPVVRPDHETTAFGSWYYKRGFWQQTLVAPNSDPRFDFSGEQVQECAAAPAGPDTCWFVGSGIPLVSVTNEPHVVWTVESGNVYGPDKVGYLPRVVFLYREHSPTFIRDGFCGTRFGQQMKIHAPSDPFKTYTVYGSTNTGNVNLLGASIKGHTVTSTRAGMPKTEGFP